MLRIRIVAVSAVICLMGPASLAMAQNSSDQFRPFNGFFANLFGDGSPSQQPQRPAPNSYDSSTTSQNYRVPTRAPQPQPLPLDAAAPAAPVASTVDNYHATLPPPPTTATTRSPSTVAGSNNSFPYDGSSSLVGPALNPPPPSTWASGDAATASAIHPAPAGMPLHERLKVFRESPFGDTAQTKPTTVDPSISAPPMAAPPSGLAEAPTLAPHASDATTPPAGVPSMAPPPVEPQRPATPKAANDAAQEANVVIDHKCPLLTAETIGPRKIVVGKEAGYEVLLQNSGDLAAEEVTVTIGLPDWAEVAGASASAGEVHPMQPDHRDPCRWVLGRIEARSKEKLSLKIIPKQSKPFELAIRWDFKQAPSQALIEVQEPKLTIRLDGPREVLFGKRELYKLKLGNSGNGAADNVVLSLTPPTVGDTHPISHRLGAINAGEERSIEIELTARQAGNITIRVEANGDGGAHAELAQHVLVRRPALQLEAEGPAVQYVGTLASYKIHVRNPGDAAAKNVKLTAKLPTGARFVSGSDAPISETSVAGGKVRWSIEQVPPGGQRVLDLKCALAMSGANRLEIASSADDDIAATTDVTTRVEAMADLRLDVKDPEGPVPVGADASYELHVRNRGTKAAENVEVLVYFSNGVEPVSAHGQTHHISPGQVIFDRIPVIPPAAEVVLKVKAKAEVAGNHAFRAEVHCKAMGIRLVGEEVTHYYQDGPGLQQATAEPAKAASPLEPATRDEQRTAERQPPLPLPQSSGQPLPTPAIKR